jgi:uncharacterized membrane-anchored protein YitT (DUF2179 family)
MYSNVKPIDKFCLVQVAYGGAAGWGTHSRLLHSPRILILARLFVFFYRYNRSIFVNIIFVVIVTKKVQKIYMLSYVCVSLYFLFHFTAAAPCEHQSLICGVTNHAA